VHAFTNEHIVYTSVLKVWEVDIQFTMCSRGQAHHTRRYSSNVAVYPEVREAAAVFAAVTGLAVFLQNMCRAQGSNENAHEMEACGLG
jgi:hypothetical protein